MCSKFDLSLLDLNRPALDCFWVVLSRRFSSPFFFLEREREDKNTLFAHNNNNNSARTIHYLSYGSRERECVCVCTRVCVNTRKSGR